MQTKIDRMRMVKDTKTNMILDAAKEAFSRQGYHGTRLDDIAEAAGFTKTALYYYFDDKEKIFLSLALREYDRMISCIGKIVDKKQPILATLGMITREILMLLGEHFPLLLTMANFNTLEFQNSSNLCKHVVLLKEFQLRQLSFERIFTQLIVDSEECGRLTNEIGAENVSYYLNSLLRGIIFKWLRKGSPNDVEMEVSNLTKFIESGLLNRS